MTEDIYAFEQFLRARNKKESTIKRYKYVLADYKAHVPEKDKFTADGIQSYLAYLQGKEKVRGHMDVDQVKGSFLRFCYYALKTFFRASKVPWPLEKEDVPKADAPRRPYYSFEDIQKVLKTIEKEKNLRDWLAFRVEALAFNRRIALSMLKRWDYDTEDGVLRMPSVKRGRIVTLELDQNTRKAMDVYLKKRTDVYPALFPSLRSRDDSGAMVPESWNMLLRKYCELAGVPNKGMHAWRRGMVSYLKWVGGKSEREIFEMGDWLKENMVFQYTMLAPDFATTERRKVHPFFRTQTMHDMVGRKTEKPPKVPAEDGVLWKPVRGKRSYASDEVGEAVE